MSTSQTWFVTGVSQGLGLALVQRLLGEDHQIAATSRHQEALAAAIIQFATEARPLLHLLLGPDAYQRATHKLGVLHQEFETWRSLTASTSFGA